MANGRKTGGKNFEKGNIAGVGHGRPKAPPDIPKVKALTNTELQAIINAYMAMDEAELKVLVETPGTPMIRVIIANLILKASQGDHFKLEFMLNRLIGKVPDQPKDVNLNFNMLPKADVIEVGKQAVAYLEAGDDEEEFAIDE